jgi:hypothetical protein
VGQHCRYDAVVQVVVVRLASNSPDVIGPCCDERVARIDVAEPPKRKAARGLVRAERSPLARAGKG